MMIRRGLVVCLLCAAVGYSNASELAFEAVSIRPANIVYPRQLGPGAFRVQATVKEFIELAYKLEHYDIVGGPEWAGLATDMFDIQARTASAASMDEIRAMLAATLKDRFQLQLHFESRKRPVYLLKKTGRRVDMVEAKADAPRDARGAMQKTNDVVVARGTSMKLLAHFLSLVFKRPVLDQTGLAGSYDFTLKYDDAGEVGDISYALKTLGLTAVSSQESVRVAVIDSVMRPTEN